MEEMIMHGKTDNIFDRSHSNKEVWEISKTYKKYVQKLQK